MNTVSWRGWVLPLPPGLTATIDVNDGIRIEGTVPDNEHRQNCHVLAEFPGACGKWAVSVQKMRNGKKCGWGGHRYMHSILQYLTHTREWA